MKKWQKVLLTFSVFLGIIFILFAILIGYYVVQSFDTKSEYSIEQAEKAYQSDPSLENLNTLCARLYRSGDAERIVQYYPLFFENEEWFIENTTSEKTEDFDMGIDGVRAEYLLSYLALKQDAAFSESFAKHMPLFNTIEEKYYIFQDGFSKVLNMDSEKICKFLSALELYVQTDCSDKEKICAYTFMQIWYSKLEMPNEAKAAWDKCEDINEEYVSEVFVSTTDGKN